MFYKRCLTVPFKSSGTFSLTRLLRLAVNTKRLETRPRFFHSSPFSFLPRLSLSRRDLHSLSFSTAASSSTKRARFRSPLEAITAEEEKERAMSIHRRSRMDVPSRASSLNGARWNMKIPPRIKITLAHRCSSAILNNSWAFFHRLTHGTPRDGPRGRRASSAGIYASWKRDNIYPVYMHDSIRSVLA